MAVQAQQQVTQLVREDPSQGSRVDVVVDMGELLAVLVPIDGTRDLLRPQRQAACTELRLTEPVVMQATAARA